VANKPAPAIVFKPKCLSITIGTGRGVDVAISVHIDDHQRMWFQKRLMNYVLSPRGCLKPDDSTTVPSGGHKIGFAVSIHVSRLNIRRPGLPVGNPSLGPWFGAV
jgi:hypothetical protein